MADGALAREGRPARGVLQHGVFSSGEEESCAGRREHIRGDRGEVAQFLGDRADIHGAYDAGVGVECGGEVSWDCDDSYEMIPIL